MAGMSGGAAPAAAPAPAADPLASFKSDIEKRAAGFGPGAKLVSQKAQSNAKGWKGYAITLRFDDVTKLQLSMGGGDEAGGPGGEKPRPMTIVFRKGPKPAVMFQTPPAPKAAPAPAAAAGPNLMPSEAMGPMLAGMRMALLVEVDGKIVRTNSRYPRGERRVALLDLPMDKVMANPQGAALIGSNAAQGPDSLRKLWNLNIDGVAIEDLERGVAIEWE